MEKITWREVYTIGEEVRKVTYHGVSLGAVKDCHDKTFLIVRCDDGHVREVPIDEIIPY